MRINYLRFINLLIFAFIVFSSMAQNPSDPMIWIQATEKVTISKKVSALLLFQHRIFLEKEQTSQQIYWASGGYKLTDKIAVGGGLIYFTYHKMVGDSYKYVPETRPFQYVSYTDKLGKVKLDFRVMVEERYMSSVVDGEIQTGEKFNTRYRIRTRGFIPLSKRVKVELNNELLFNGHNLESDFFGQNRVTLRVHYSLKNWSFLGGYMQWTVNTAKGIVHRPSGLVGFGHKLSLKKNS